MKPFEQKLCNIEINVFDKDIVFKQIDYYKKHFQRFNIIINLNNYNDYNDLKNIVECIENAGLSPLFCNFMINVKNKVFSKTEYSNILKFIDYLDEKGTVLFFKELNVLWFDNEFKKAYSQMYATVDILEDKILSPLEQLLYLYKQAASHIYTEEGPFDAKIFSRSLVGIHNTGKIVCSGYADLLTAYCSLLNSPNIKCSSTPVNLYTKNTNEYKNGHCFNIVYLDDPKYDLKGYYVLDPCWDSINADRDNMKLSYFLLPIIDTKSYSTYTVKGVANDKFFGFFDDPKYLLSSDIKEIGEILKDQTLLDIKKERKLFEQKIIDQYMKYTITPSPEKIKEIKTSLGTRTGTYEHTFLKTMLKKILQQTKNPDYTTIKTALKNMCIYGENMDITTAHKFTETVLQDTKSATYYSFDETATNCFSVWERDIRKKTRLFVEQQRARRQAYMEKKSLTPLQKTETTYE